MRNRFRGKSCVLCSRSSYGVGEHVWSHWLLSDFEGEGRFTTEKSGVTYKNRDHVPWTAESLPGVNVPMCEVHNDSLNRLVEQPAKPVVRSIPRSNEGAWPTLSRDEAADLGRWLLKVGLLLAHPDAEHGNPLVKRDPDLVNRGVDDDQPEWVNWMSDGVDPSDDFSVFVTRRASQEPDGRQDNGDEGDWGAQITLPGKMLVGTRTLTFFQRSLGVRDLQATVVWHPGWPLRHPLVESGRAAALWPRPAGPVDLEALPPVGPREFRFVTTGGDVRVDEETYARVTAQTPLQVGLWPPTALIGQFSG